jgi:hypothetical protein
MIDLTDYMTRVNIGLGLGLIVLLLTLTFFAKFEKRKPHSR